MGSRALFLLQGVASLSAAARHRHLLHHFSKLTSSQALTYNGKKWVNRIYSVMSSLEPPVLSRLAQTGRISLTPTEGVHCNLEGDVGMMFPRFGQLQYVDLESIDPAIRAGTDVGSFRDDIPNTFENREAMITAVPSYDEPYIKVPKILKEE